MLDAFEVLTTSGVVLWSKHYAPVGANIVNSFIKDIFIEDNVLQKSGGVEDVSAARNAPYRKEKYTLKWTTAKDLGLIFVAVYQSLIHLSWIDQLLDNIKTLFTTLYRDQFKKPNTSIVDCPFDDYFNRQVEELEKNAAGTRDGPQAGRLQDSEDTNEEVPGLPWHRGGLKPPSKTVEDLGSSTDVTPVPTPDSSRPATPSSSVLTEKKSRRARKGGAGSTTSAILSSKLKAGDIKKTKKGRRWDGDGIAEDDDDKVLDYSAANGDDSGDLAGTPNEMGFEEVAQESWSRRTKGGEVVLKDLDEEMDSILASAKNKREVEEAAIGGGGIVGTGMGAISGLFRSVIGGKTLTQEDLAKPVKGMEEHLIKKNVARDAAVHLCQSVEKDLVGTKTASFQSIDKALRDAMERAVSKVLTPSTSLDLLRSIQAVSSKSSSNRRPYVISVVGVNGVGKSTTLAKLAFLLLHNNHRIMVCAADTFRSGAVEQLRVHVRNLQQLTSQGSDLGEIDLFERGYGRDAAHIAREAVEHATSQGFDVVLIDTAGRRHNDSRLMASLEPFARQAKPDKILMVGEALVGTDSVAQARHFNSSFGAGRQLDGFIVSKCDTVGEMVGTLVSMVYATGVPIVAVGVGQHYGDLRGMNVSWATNLLMS